MSRLRSVGAWLLTLGWLHALASLPLPFQASAWLRNLALPGHDLVALLALAVLAGACARPRLGAHLAAFGLLLSVLFRAACDTSELVFVHRFELIDLPVVPVVFETVLQGQGRGVRIAALVGIAVVLLLVHWLSMRAFRRVARAAERPLVAGFAALLLQAWVIVVIVAGDGRQLQSTGRSSALLKFADAFTRAVPVWLDPAAVEARIDQAIAAGKQRLSAVPDDLERLRGVDVHVLVVESYGRLLFDLPSDSAAAPWPALAAAIESKGFATVSGFVTPTILGGRSWLAHAELLTSVEVPEQWVFERLIASDLVALPQRFRRAGWTTVELMPAMDRHWPEGDAFYGIDRTVTQLELGYDGHSYPFAPAPDQFVLCHLLKKVLPTAEKPVFSLFVGATSHAPWAQVPPFVADWQIGPESFRGGPARVRPLTYASLPHDPELVPAYRESIACALRAAFGFVERLERPSLVFVLGDHQPPLGRTFVEAEARRDVPLHVISNRPELLEPYRRAGFTDGLVPPTTQAALPLVEVAPLILRSGSR